MTAAVNPPALQLRFIGVGLRVALAPLSDGARLPRGMKSGVKSKVFQSALQHDVLYVPGELCYAEDPARRKPNHEMRLSFGSASEENIRKGIARLGKVLRKFV